MNEVTLVLVCKRPAPGVGKQRLAAKLGRKKTYQIAEALLMCALEDAADWPGPVVIAPAHAEDSDWARSLSIPHASRVTIVPQIAGNLGQRLNALDQTLRLQGMQHLFFIGSDAPGLLADDYAMARDALQHTDVALIPAADGGVVLMANRRPWPDLSNLPWSSNRLGESLIGLCRQAGNSVSAIGHGSDVDEWCDVVRLATSLRQDPRPARRALLLQVNGILSNRDGRDA
ncbi:TIGR04282 family arsenosugar biosynthesis glycosyltransferase [Nitrosomonas sp.]|uniref:TIGR04282 family arsenosugar biosynthesis glycosyltransferase n=1 Tax=Nitrosomonas sp. TaxID=42353 RepID=UPI001D385E43|nr:DUF2064 domain-containing protein [Nitrosomonas sp.]MBX3616673.1 DUF2064 domain-containing protein [Nitrosomonas sp.]